MKDSETLLGRLFRVAIALVVYGIIVGLLIAGYAVVAGKAAEEVLANLWIAVLLMGLYVAVVAYREGDKDR
ncbi:hypothetical protein [Dermabacter hominis]|uniref:hypothetical protein n=1 Tax=Dermabacter hominis TaxID=36740 RepID=UPI00242E83D3|nr:hypothetical protein [Dermabacter hominis]